MKAPITYIIPLINFTAKFIVCSLEVFFSLSFIFVNSFVLGLTKFAQNLVTPYIRANLNIFVTIAIKSDGSCNISKLIYVPEIIHINFDILYILVFLVNLSDFILKHFIIIFANIELNIINPTSTPTAIKISTISFAFIYSIQSSNFFKFKSPQ